MESLKYLKMILIYIDLSKYCERLSSAKDEMT